LGPKLLRRVVLSPTLFCLAVVVFCSLTAAPARAQIGAPVDLSVSGRDRAVKGAPAPLSITTSVSVPAGASIIVIAVANTNKVGGAPASAACSDSAGNTYHTDISESGDGHALTTICSTHGLAAELAQGSTITVTWTGGRRISGVRMHAFSVTGLASVPLDQTASSSGTSVSVSSGAVATTQADELLFGVITSEFSGEATGSGFTAGNGYTSPGGVGSTAPDLLAEYSIVSATGSYAATGSLTEPPRWQALLATYKAAAPAPADGAPPFDTCLKDNTTGNLLQWNSTTGQYQFTRCSDGFMLTGTGTARLVNGIRTLTDFKADRRLSAGLNPGQLTGNAIIYINVAVGVWQTVQVFDTNPSAVCSCAG